MPSLHTYVWSTGSVDQVWTPQNILKIEISVIFQIMLQNQKRINAQKLKKVFAQLVPLGMGDGEVSGIVVDPMA